MDDDDWLNDDNAAQGSSRDPLVEQEYQKLAQRYSDAGYREGITDGKLSTLQQGFDQSFATSVPLSRRIGKLRGSANALLSFCLRPTPSPARSVTSGVDEALIADLREYIRELGAVRRTQVLPRDKEREAHEREDHGESGFELDINSGREMDGLEAAMGGMGIANGEKGVNGDADEVRGKEAVLSFAKRLEVLKARMRGGSGP